MTGSTILTKEVFHIDAAKWVLTLEEFIRSELRNSRRDRIVVTVSGGLDSSVVAALCVRAVGKDKVVCLMLPERMGNPEALHYGRMLVDHLGVQAEKINISPILRALKTSDLMLSALSGRSFWKTAVNRSMLKKGHTTKSYYLDFLAGTLDPTSRKLIAKVNSKNRVRVLVAYKFADENNCLVAGSTHRTERMVGLFCKHGIDDCADIMPLKNLHRSHILQLADYLKIPSAIVQRSPNPDILPGVTDKYMSYLGMDYLKVDLILYGLEKKLSIADITSQLCLSKEAVQEVSNIVSLSEIMRAHSLAPDCPDR